MASFNKGKTQEGFLLVDVLIGLFIATILTTAFIGSVVAAVRYAGIQAKAVQAELLAIEMLEVVRELETSTIGWDKLSTEKCAESCYPFPEGGAWKLIYKDDPEDDVEKIGAFTRWLSIEPVKRDDLFAIDGTGSGTLDPNTKKITATVTWNTPQPLTLQTYVYDHS